MAIAETPARPERRTGSERPDDTRLRAPRRPPRVVALIVVACSQRARRARRRGTVRQRSGRRRRPPPSEAPAALRRAGARRPDAAARRRSRPSRATSRSAGSAASAPATHPSRSTVERQVADDFNASHPEHPARRSRATSYAGARDALSVQLASGNGPDVVGPVGIGGAERSTASGSTCSRSSTRTTIDLTQYPESTVNLYNAGGEGQLGIPYAIYPSVLFYKQDLFKEAGLDEPPHEWGEHLHDAGRHRGRRGTTTRSARSPRS